MGWSQCPRQELERSPQQRSRKTAAGMLRGRSLLQAKLASFCAQRHLCYFLPEGEDSLPVPRSLNLLAGQAAEGTHF